MVALYESIVIALNVDSLVLEREPPPPAPTHQLCHRHPLPLLLLLLLQPSLKNTQKQTSRYTDVTLQCIASTRLKVAVWLSGNVVGRINEVNQRRARLVLGWVTICRCVNHLGM